MRMRFIFGDDWNDAPPLSGFLDFRAFSDAFYSIQKQIVGKKKLDSPKGESNGLLTLDCEQSLVSLLGHSKSTTLKSEKMTPFKAVASPFRVRLSLRLTTRNSPGLFQAPGYSDLRNWESAITKIKREETAEPPPRFSQITRSYFRVRFIYVSSLISESLEHVKFRILMLYNHDVIRLQPKANISSARFSGPPTLVTEHAWYCRMSNT